MRDCLCSAETSGELIEDFNQLTEKDQSIFTEIDRSVKINILVYANRGGWPSYHVTSLQNNEPLTEHAKLRAKSVRYKITITRSEKPTWQLTQSAKSLVIPLADFFL